MDVVQFGVLFLLCILLPCNALLNVVVGKSVCTVRCSNYFQASSSDASIALNRAFLAVNKAGGGSVRLQAGSYTLAKNIEMYKNTAFIGAGMDVTTLVLRNFAAPFVKAGLIRATMQTGPGCDTIKIAHMTLNGNKAKQHRTKAALYGRYGIFTEGCNGVVIDYVKVINFQGYGHDPHGWKKGGVYAKNLVITNSISSENDWDGFTLDQTDGIYVNNCTAVRNGRHGFNIVTGSRNVVVRNVRSVNNGYYYYTGDRGCGFKVQNNMRFGTNTVSLTDSVFNGDNKASICLVDVFKITINRNRFKTGTHSSACVCAQSVKNSLVSNNICDHPKRVLSCRGTNTNLVYTNNVFQTLPTLG